MTIIKQSSKYAANIYKFSFVENPAENLTAAPDYSSSPQFPPGTADLSCTEALLQQGPAAPGMDVAQIEKTAYENGFHQGEKTGLEIAEKKVEAIMRRYSETLLELGRLRSDLYVQVEREVVKLALEVAKKIVHREIQVDEEIIQTLVRVALNHVAEKSAVTVHLHPTDYNYILERKAELFSGDHGVREVALLADRSIERGGCLIKTECGDIDARIEEEFREIERGFFDGLKQPSPSDPARQS